MAITDYNKKKKLDVDSVSGTPTVGKAQPILLVDGNDSTTGNGDIVIDFTNISDAQDIAVYDQNGNLLDYEIESLDATAGTGVLWCYNSWVRDGTTQAQVAYGSNSANKDRQNVTAAWGNTGQNVVMVQHLNGNALDSTSNNHDGTWEGESYVSGEFADAGSFDGSNDTIFFNTTFQQGTSAITVVSWANADAFASSASDTIMGDWDSEHTTWLRVDPSEALSFPVEDSGGNNVLPAGSTTLSINTDYHLAGTYSASNGGKVWVDGNQDGSAAGNGNNIANKGSNEYWIGERGSGKYWDGWIDEVRIYSDEKGGTWMQADYDVSPKAGQVFFSQQAAETTTTTVSATVSDSLAFAEITNTQLIINQLVSDQLNLTENTGSTISFTASDSLAIKENNQTTLSETLSESLGFNEATTSQLQDKLTDQLNLSENTVGVLIDTLTEQIAFNENIITKLALTVTVADTLTFGERTDSKLFDTITEQLGLTENVNSTLINAYADQLNLTENVQAAIAEILSDQLQFTEQTSTSLAATLADSLDFSENLESQLIDTLTDSLGFTEATAKAIAANLTDQLQFTENLESFITLQLADQLDFSEETIGAFSETFTDQLTFSDQVLFATLLEIDAPTKAIITNVNKFAVMENHVFKEGDRADEVSATLEDENGAIDLSNANSVDIVMQDRAGSTVLDTTATIQNAANGEVTYSWSSGDPIDTAGIYRLEWRINDGSGKQETVPNDGYITIEIEEELG